MDITLSTSKVASCTLTINATALSWLGCTHEELIGKRRALEFLTPEGQAPFHQNFGRPKAQGRVEGLVFDLVRVRGTSRRGSVTATVINNAGDLFEMSRTVKLQITDLNQKREAVRQLTAEQSSRVLAQDPRDSAGPCLPDPLHGQE